MWTFFISKKYLLSKQKEGMISLIGVISVLGVTIGVASLIIVMSIMNGFDSEIKDKIIGTYAHIVVTKQGGIDDYTSVEEKIKESPSVVTTSGFISGQAILRSNGRITGILVKGIDPEKENQVNDLVTYLGGGGKLTSNTIILGSELMKAEGIRPGDYVELMRPYSMLDIEKEKFKVVGAFTSGRYDYDANIVILNLDAARKLFRVEGVTSIGVKVTDEMKVDSIKEDLKTSLRYPFLVRTWMDLDQNLVKALALEKKMMFIILALIIMVACFNIAGSLMMMVMEKTKDIGILKAIGANSRGISLVFLFEGALIGFFGIGLGTASGIFIAERINAISEFIEQWTGFNLFPNDVYYFTSIPVKIDPVDVATIASVAFILTLLAGLYPARKAARLDPVEAIRYE